MNLRPYIVIAALLSSSLVLAQVRAGKSLLEQENPTRTQSASSHDTYQGSPIDTLQMFPQVSSSIGTKIIKPENPTIDMTIGSVKSRFNGAPSKTSLIGPASEQYFPGIGMTGFVPADPDVAVGPAHIVQVVNSRIAFYSKGGALQFSQNSPTFFSGIASTGSQFDPKVMYDRIAGRFVIVFLEVTGGGGQISNVLFAVSDDSNPNGLWHRYNFSVKAIIGGTSTWFDYPGFGYNKDGYVFNGNMFPFAGGGSVGVQFVTVPKTPVLSGGAVTVSKFFDLNSGSAQMAETVDSTNGFVYGAARRFTNNTRFYAFSNVGTAAPTMNFADIAVTNSPIPLSSASSTGGASFDTVGPRIFTAIFRNNRMYLSYNHGNGARVGVRWTELNMGTWPTAGTITQLQAGNYNSGTLNYFMPAINVNKHGDVSILFTGSNTAVTSDLVVAGRISTDAANTMSGPTIMAGATGSPYNHNRWGDYFGIDVDPIDDETFWGTGMVVRADGWWATHIVSWTVSKTSFLAPTIHNWFRGLPQSGNTASLANDDGNYNVARAHITLFPGEPPAQLVVDATAPSGQVLDFEFNVIAKVNTPGLSQRVQLWDFTNSQWVSFSTQASTTSDSLHTVVVGGTLSDYVQAGTRTVRARVQWFQTGIALLFPWSVSVDQVEWEIRVR